MTNINFCFVLIFLNSLLEISCYIIPIPKFELLPSNNILISIPGKEGLAWVNFHGAVNREIRLYETGDFNSHLSKNADNDWTFEIKNNFNESDVIYYWIYAQFNDEGFWQSDNLFELKTLLQKTIYEENFVLSPEDCLETITTITGYKKQICKDQLIFDETFDIYNTTKWQREIKFNGFDGEFVLYEDKPQNLYIKDGNLHIVPTLTTETSYSKIFGTGINIDLGNRCTEEEQIDYFCRRNGEYRILPPVTSAKIRTKSSFSFRYGRVDIRAKLPKGDWIFPQIFLEPLNNIYASQSNHEYLAGQMRIAFIRSNEVLHHMQGPNFYDGSVLIGGILLHNFEGIYMVLKIHPEQLGNNFHIYSILWTDRDIKLYIDNDLYGTVYNSFSNTLPKELIKNNKSMEPFHEPFYISLGVGVGGYNVFFPDNTLTVNNTRKPWRNDDPNAETKFWLAKDEWIKTWKNKNHELVVDYIKVWSV